MEYAVKMRRLPKEGMMDVLLARNNVSPEMLTKVAQKLADFHKKAETNAAISAFGELATITQNTEENFSQTDKYVGRTVSRESYQSIANYTRNFIKDNAPLFRRRVDGGKIRDCHGDLHAPHICFTPSINSGQADGICIYDCIEFNDRFRYCDVASEIAFLAMDLDHYGHSNLSRNFFEAYIDFSKDKTISKLLNFYKCYRAYVRGKVEGFKLDDPHILSDEKTRVLMLPENILS
ncbi:MAG: hypothetical protein V1767_08220 [Chloroflexota bacterium]